MAGFEIEKTEDQRDEEMFAKRRADLKEMLEIVLTLEYLTLKGFDVEEIALREGSSYIKLRQTPLP